MAIKTLLLALALVSCTTLAEKTPAEIYGHSNEDIIDTVDVSGDGGIVKLGTWASVLRMLPMWWRSPPSH